MNNVYIIPIAGALIGIVAVMFGLWWAPFLIGAAYGVAFTRARVAVPIGAVSGLLAWLVPLLVDEVRYGIGPSATALAAIMGFDHQGAVPLVLTLLVATLLGFTGAWIASGARLLIAPARR